MIFSRRELLQTSLGFSLIPNGVYTQEPQKSEFPVQSTGHLKLEGATQAFLTKTNYPGVWIAAAQGGRVVSTICGGYSDLTSRTPARLDNVVRIGSVSKPFVGTVIAQAVQQGAIRYEDTLYTVCPGLKEVGRQEYADVTLEMLLAHVGGIPVDKRLNVQGNHTSAEFPQLRWNEALEIVKQEPVSSPGDKYNYSNSGIQLAAIMLERKTGKSYENWFNEVINLQLKVVSAGLGEVKEKGTQPNLIANGVVKPPPSGIHWPYSYGPYGNVHCTIEDLVQFGLSHCLKVSGGRRFAVKMLEGMHHQYKPTTATRCSFSRGELSDSGYLLFHGGSLTVNRGDSTMLWVAPKSGTVVAAFTNVSKRTEQEGVPPGNVLKDEIVRPLFNQLNR
jgi:CubicO group peptidase (beta-lactamase class C family)